MSSQQKDLTCKMCGASVTPHRGRRGRYVFACECLTAEGRKVAPLPYQGDPEEAHDSWEYDDV